jgi:glycosyltransferase involved in cell wall biosynthesis
MGKPVLTNSGIGDCDEIVQKNKAGIILDDFTEKAYEKAIAQMEILLKQGEDHFRNVAKEYFSLGKGIKEYDAIYSRLQN